MKQVTVALDLYLLMRAVAAASMLIARGIQVEGMVLLDPVDATPQDPESVLDNLTQVRVATLILGGGADDGGCSPGKCHFLNSIPVSSWQMMTWLRHVGLRRLVHSVA